VSMSLLVLGFGRADETGLVDMLDKTNTVQSVHVYLYAE
jgi:hypothetical protein